MFIYDNRTFSVRLKKQVKIPKGEKMEQETFAVGDVVNWHSNEIISLYELYGKRSFEVMETIKIVEDQAEPRDFETGRQFVCQAAGHHQWLHISEEGKLVSNAGKPIKFSGYWFKKIDSRS
jgi:hypothetical protein